MPGYKIMGGMTEAEYMGKKKHDREKRKKKLDPNKAPKPKRRGSSRTGSTKRKTTTAKRKK